MVEAQNKSSIAEWDLAEELGAGAYGTAYLGINTNSNLQAAVKVFKDLGADCEESFA
jgi:hypothetical protein